VVPAASPFNPSMKFIALVTYKIHPSDSTGPNHPSSTPPINGKSNFRADNPAPTATSAATNCAPSFTRNGKSNRSSSSETTAISTAAAITPRNSGAASRETSPYRYSSEIPSRNAATIPTPPDFGVTRVCALRASGRSGTPTEIMVRTTMPENRASPASKAK
jgi:hypothetical protein